MPTSYTQAKNMRLTDNRIRQLPILAPKSAYGQPADQTMQILLWVFAPSPLRQSFTSS